MKTTTARNWQYSVTVAWKQHILECGQIIVLQFPAVHWYVTAGRTRRRCSGAGMHCCWVWHGSPSQTAHTPLPYPHPSSDCPPSTPKTPTRLWITTTLHYTKTIHSGLCKKHLKVHWGNESAAEYHPSMTAWINLISVFDETFQSTRREWK